MVVQNDTENCMEGASKQRESSKENGDVKNTYYTESERQC